MFFYSVIDFFYPFSIIISFRYIKVLYMQDKILLGFLMSGEKTGYQIKHMMQKSTDFFFSTSFGSIYPAFASLTDRGLVNVSESVEKGKHKKCYAITEKGRDEFLQWLARTPAISRIRDEALLRIFFFSHLSREIRPAQIREYADLLEEQARALEKLESRIDSNAADPFNLMTLRFGIDYYRWIRERCLGLADEIQKLPEKKIP